MPQAIIALLPILGTTTAGIIAANVIATVLISVALTKVESLFLGNKPSAGAPPPLNVTGRGTTEFRRIVLGTVRCAGSVVFCQTAGANNSQLFMVVVYAGHAIGAETHAYIPG
jgi:hypothetical protein